MTGDARPNFGTGLDGQILVKPQENPMPTAKVQLSAPAAPPAGRPPSSPNGPGSTTPSSRMVSSASRANSRVAFDSGRARCCASAITSNSGSTEGRDVQACREGRTVDHRAAGDGVADAARDQLERRLDVLDLDHRFQPQPGELSALGQLPAGRVLPAVVGVVEHQVGLGELR